MVSNYGDDFLKTPKNTGIKGSILMPGEKNIQNVFIFVYDNELTDLIGPSYIISKSVDSTGVFTIDLPPGIYFIVARKRHSGNITGALVSGDYSSIYKNNPVKVSLGKYTAIDKIVLKEIDKKKLMKITKEGFLRNKDTGIEGTIVDVEGHPLFQMYALVYKKTHQVGKPIYISSLTGNDGKFIMHLTPGIYYLGARSMNFGPIKFGELVGGYDETPDHLIKIEKGKIIKGIKIIAKKWDPLSEE